MKFFKREGNIEKNLVNKNFQLICIILHVCIVSFFLYFPVRYFFSLDPFLTAKDEYRENSRAKTADNLIDVKVHLQDFLDADIHRGTAKIDLLLTTTYNKNYVKSADINQIDFIFGYGKQMTLVNRVEQGDQVTETYRVLFNGSFDLNYKMFPFNDHVFNFAIMFPLHLNPNVQKGACTFEKIEDINGWRIVKSDIFYGGETTSGNGIWCSLAMSKMGYRSIISVLLPLYILLFIGLFTLSFNPEKSFSTILSIMLGINAFRVVLENATPKVSYFVMSDFFFMILLLFAFIALLFHLFSAYIHKNLKYLFIIGVHMFIIGFMFSYTKEWIFNGMII